MDYAEKLEKIWEIFKWLPREPGGQFWFDGSEILCKKESDADAVADFIDALCGEAVCHTGFYDPDEDRRNGEVDAHTGYWYIDFD